MKAIARKLNIKEFTCEIRDLRGNLIYSENSSGKWSRREYDSNDNELFYENSFGFWAKRKYDSNNNQIYYEDSHGTIINGRKIH